MLELRKDTFAPAQYNVTNNIKANMSTDLQSSVAAFMKHSFDSNVQADQAVKKVSDKARHVNKHKDDYLKK